MLIFNQFDMDNSLFFKKETGPALTALISKRAVNLIGLLDIRALNLTDLEHSTH